MKCPSLEQIYDMDIDNLLILKSDIEQNKINFDMIPLDEDDYDLYDYNTPNDKNSILELINLEIKERESTKDLLNFFTNLNFETNNINTIESKFLQELNNNNNNNKKENNIFQFQKNSNISEQKHLYSNGYLSNKNIFNKNNNINQPVKLTPNEGIKSLLSRTKIDPTQLQYTVSSNKYVDKYWSIDKERKNRKKIQNNKIPDNVSNINNNTNFSSNASSYNSHITHRNLKNNIKSERKNCIISEKIIIGAIPFEKKYKKTKKKKKKIKKEDEVKKINTLELMRNYKVSDITQFLKKKTSLKPLNISTAINKNNNLNNKNNFKGKEYIPNIKLYNKTLSDTNEKNECLNNNKKDINNQNNDLNNSKKNNEENILNNNVNKILSNDIGNSICIDHFYFQYENGNFNGIIYEVKKYKELYNIKSNILYKKSNKSSYQNNLLKIESPIFNEIKNKDITNSIKNISNNIQNENINQVNKKENEIVQNKNIPNKNENNNIYNKRNETNDNKEENNFIDNGKLNNKNCYNKDIFLDPNQNLINNRKNSEEKKNIVNELNSSKNVIYNKKIDKEEITLQTNDIKINKNGNNLNVYSEENNIINKFDENKNKNNNNPILKSKSDIDKDINKYPEEEKKEEFLKEEENEEYEEEEEEIEEENTNFNNNQNINKNYNNQLILPKNNRTEQRKFTLNPIKPKSKNFNLNSDLVKSPISNINSKINKINNSHDHKNLSEALEQNISSPKQQTKKYVLSSVKPHTINSCYAFNKNLLKFQAQRPKSTFPKNQIIDNHNVNLENIRDYSEIYGSFSELFSGYFLSNNYSQQGNFNLNNTVGELYESFNKLYYYELNQELIKQKDEMYSDIVRAEAGVIVNRIKHAQEKLLKEEDINTNIEKYCILKKCLELERKNYAREYNDNLDNNDNDDDFKYKKFFRVVLSRPEIYDIVCYTLYKDSSWSELPHGLSLGQCWNLYWSYGPPGIEFSKLFSFQKVNHLINNRVVHRKDLLHKHIMRVRKLNKKCNEIFNIMPLTFLLSKEYVNFVEEFHRMKDTDDYNIWIVKPVGKSRGKGIFLIDNISDVPLNDTFLVQKYLTSPLLLDEGYKFDMRIYCLVTSVNPLEMFLYKDGFARVSNELYSMDISNMKVHLTNAAIQNRQAKKSKNFEKIYGGSKISLDMLRDKLRRQYGIDFDSVIWPQVKDIIVKVFICCQNDIPYCPSTFEMFGFDVIIDSNLKCWLLEINSSPSLERSNVLDDEIKLPLVQDIIKIVDPIEVDKFALINVLERVMKIKNNQKNKNIYLYSPKIQLNIDLTNIFKGKIPRKFGEEPKDTGRFEMICPNKETDKLIRMAGGQKYYNNKKEKK